MTPRATKQSFFDPFHRLLKLQFGTDLGLFGQFLEGEFCELRQYEILRSSRSLPNLAAAALLWFYLTTTSPFMPSCSWPSTGQYIS